MLLLLNTAGEEATGFNNAGASATTDPAYDENTLISGARSTRWKSTDSAVTKGIGYLFSADVSADYAIITRGDLLAVNTTSPSLTWRQRNSGGTWSNLGSAIDPTSYTFQGPYRQDIIAAISPSDERGYGARLTQSAGSSAMMINQLWFADSFDFGQNPETIPRPTFEDIPDSDRDFTPLQGYFPYATEKRFQLTFKALTNTTLDAFYDLCRTSRALRGPVILYDDTGTSTAGDFWDYKSEHVIIENYQANYSTPDYADLTLVCRRLAHYDRE